MPVITNVQSLANRPQTPTDRTVSSSGSQTIIPAPVTQVKQQVIVKHAPYPEVKNKATSCKPIRKNKSVMCGVTVSHKEVQTGLFYFKICEKILAKICFKFQILQKKKSELLQCLFQYMFQFLYICIVVHYLFQYHSHYRFQCLFSYLLLVILPQVL